MAIEQLSKSNLEKLMKGKQIYNHEEMWTTFTEDYKDLITINLLKFGKKIDEISIATFFLYAISNKIPAGITEANHYINDKFPLDGLDENKVVDTHPLFQIIWPEKKYQKELEGMPKKLIASLIGEGHYELFQYINKKYIETNMLGMLGTEHLESYPSYRAVQLASELRKKNAPRIAIDLRLVDNFIKDMASYRNIKEYPIEKLPEYNEIKNLFSKEDANMLFTFLKSITKKPGEKTQNHLTRLIEDCEKFSKKEGQIKDHFYVPILVQLSKYVDDKEYIKTSSLNMKIKKLNENYILLRGVDKLIDNHEITNEAIFDLRKDLLRVSFKNTVSLASRYFTRKIDEKIEKKRYHIYEKKIMEMFEGYSKMWEKIFPDDKIPYLHYDLKPQNMN